MVGFPSITIPETGQVLFQMGLRTVGDSNSQIPPSHRFGHAELPRDSCPGLWSSESYWGEFEQQSLLEKYPEYLDFPAGIQQAIGCIWWLLKWSLRTVLTQASFDATYLLSY